MNSYIEKYLKYKNQYLKYKIQSGGKMKIRIDNKKVDPRDYQLWSYYNFIEYEQIYISTDYKNIYGNFNYKLLPDLYKGYMFILKKKGGNIYFIKEDGERYIIFKRNYDIIIIINNIEYFARDYQKYAYDDFIKYEKLYSTRKIDNYVTIPIEHNNDGLIRNFIIRKNENNDIYFISELGQQYLFIEEEKEHMKLTVIEHPNNSTLEISTKSNKLIGFNNAILLYEIYNAGYAFPEWVLNYFNWKRFPFDNTLVVYDNEYNITEVKDMVKYREPVNISMDRHYNIKLLHETFNYRNSNYIYENNKLKPNIAIYCNALVKTAIDFKSVHVINLIGYAFDDIEQPDYKYYNYMKTILKKTNEEIQNDLILKYRKVWLKACIIAKRLNLNKILLFNVGGGAFSIYLSNFGITNFIKKIFEPSFNNDTIHENIITPKKFCEIYNINITYGFDQYNGSSLDLIPDCLSNKKYDLEKTLFINAWDPHTIIGNGNNNDSSLDGYWGRISNMSVLGWSLTNDKIKYLSIKY